MIDDRVTISLDAYNNLIRQAMKYETLCDILYQDAIPSYREGLLTLDSSTASDYLKAVDYEQYSYIYKTKTEEKRKKEVLSSERQIKHEPCGSPLD